MSVQEELESLRDAHDALAQARQDLTRVTDALDMAAGGQVWTGRSAETFRQTWTASRPTLNPRLIDALGEAAADVRLQHNNLAEATGQSDRI